MTSNAVTSKAGSPKAASGTVTLAKALIMGLRRAMERDPKVVLIGVRHTQREAEGRRRIAACSRSPASFAAPPRCSPKTRSSAA